MSEIITANELIDQITQVLQSLDGKNLQEIANEILENQVLYLGDSTFKQYSP